MLLTAQALEKKDANVIIWVDRLGKADFKSIFRNTGNSIIII